MTKEHEDDAPEFDPANETPAAAEGDQSPTAVKRAEDRPAAARDDDQDGDDGH